MKQTIITTIFALMAIVSIYAQKTIVWKNPSAFMGASNSEFKITKVKLKQTETVLHLEAHYGPGTDHNILINTTLNGMENEDCKAVYHEYQAEQERIAQQLAGQKSVFIKKFDDVAPEIILQTILDRYKGKVVLIDIDGDHYYLTKEQYNYILQHYESEGIPTYAIYDTEGRQTFKKIGFSSLDIFKDEVEKVLK